MRANVAPKRQTLLETRSSVRRAFAYGRAQRPTKLQTERSFVGARRELMMMTIWSTTTVDMLAFRQRQRRD
jgi:hypothetical protein